MVIARLKRRVRVFKSEVPLYKLVLKDSQTPLHSKILLAVAIGYANKPFHLIPHFIPIISHYDDFIFLVPPLYFAKHSLPREIVDKHRKQLLKNY